MDLSCTTKHVINDCSPNIQLKRMGSDTSVIIDLENNNNNGVVVGVESSVRKLNSSQYKGVVPQPNGRWGAQIYEKHQRVWLGTFNEEDEAARAYDVAAQRFRGRDALTNFKPLGTDHEADFAEYSFLTSHSKVEIVDMLRKHTYTDELEQHSKQRRQSASNINKLLDPKFLTESISGLAREKLFEKALTPSDVGKLNRLVIPKQYAEKYFPLQRRTTSSLAKGVLMNFKDAGGKVWRFRYSYWNSSQSYVLTKGWRRFVREMNLHAGDVVRFYKSSGADRQLYIDLFKSQQELLGLENHVIRLFGVNIGKSTIVDDRKRMREMELFGFEMCKRRKRVC